jgi:peptide subunit release factor 1 (eRF1)
LSALKCPECSKGWLLPIDPIDDESVWKCDKCFHQMESIKERALVDELKKELESIETRDVNW